MGGKPSNFESSYIFTDKDINRFWEKVNRKSLDECWDWQASLFTGGYGKFCLTDWQDHNIRRDYAAHRVSWVICKGPIPDDKLVLHKCDNRKCVNPRHLYLGNQSDNVSDRVYRNPGSFVANCRTSMFYEGEIWLIKRLCNAGYTRRFVAKMFKCSHSQINKIVHNEYRYPKKLEA